MIREQIFNESLYFIINKFEIASREYIFKYPIPIRICLEYYYTYNEVMGDNKFLIIRKVNSSDTTELVVDDVSKKLLRLQVISSNQITFHNLNFNNHYLNHNSYIAIEISNNSFEKWEKFLPSLNTQIKIHIFNNTVVLILDEKACPVYMFSENNEFSILTDKNLNIIAFFINSITAKDKIVIKEHATSPYSSNQESRFPFNLCETTIMENKRYLIKKINELENVDQWHIIYYGLERKLINNEFVVDYAMFLLEKAKTSDQFTLDIASLLEHELGQISILFEQRIADKDEIMIAKGQFYNKIWFYLSLAADMCTEKIIK